MLLVILYLLFAWGFSWWVGWRVVVADLDGFAVNIFLSLSPVGKCLFIRIRELCLISLLTFLLYGGLYHRTSFHFLLLFFVGSIGL